MTSTLNFGGFGQSAPNPQAQAPSQRPQAQVWLNVGVTVPMQKSDGTVEDTFISLPVGIPLDTMEPQANRGSNPDMAQIIGGKNAILARLQEMARGLQPGQEAIVEGGLQLQLKRVGSPVAAPVSGNLIDLVNARMATPAKAADETETEEAKAS